MAAPRAPFGVVEQAKAVQQLCPCTGGEKRVSFPSRVPADLQGAALGVGTVSMHNSDFAVVTMPLQRAGNEAIVLATR